MDASSSGAVDVASLGSTEAPCPPDDAAPRASPMAAASEPGQGVASALRGRHRGHEAFGWLSVEELLRQALRQHARQTGELRAEVARLRAELGAAEQAVASQAVASQHTAQSYKFPDVLPPQDPPRPLAPPASAGSSEAALGGVGAGTHGDGTSTPTKGALEHRETAAPKRAQTTSMGRTKAKAVSILATGSKSTGRQRVHYENFPCMEWLDSAVKSTKFEVVFMVLILANSIVLAVEAEYQGYETGQRAELAGNLGAGSQGWGDASTAFEVVEYIFGSAFALEALMKLMVYRGAFFRHSWNDFDLFVVLFWVLEKSSSVIPVPALVLRLARLVKTLRLVRLTRTLEFADTLNLIIVAVKASLSALVWSLLLLSLITMVLALVLNYGLKAYVEDLLIEEGNREDMFIYFGTFWRSFLSVIELTIGNWVPITRDLQELISPWLAFLVVIYRLIMEIAILKVVTGVFLHETFRVAKSDSELMIRGKMREDKLFKNKMASLFTEIDTDGNGKLSKDEFDNTFKHPRASLYLGALGLNYKDTEELWRLVVQEVGRSPEDSEVSTSDLERVIGKIRGEGRSIDVVMILQQVHHLLATLADSGVIRPLSDCSSPWIPTALPVHPSSGDSLDDCSPHLQDGRSAWGEAPSI